MRAEQTGREAGSEPERFQFIHRVPRPSHEWPEGHDPEQPHATPWVRAAGGGLFRTVYIPASMNMEEARKFLHSDE